MDSNCSMAMGIPESLNLLIVKSTINPFVTSYNAAERDVAFFAFSSLGVYWLKTQPYL